jgi:hypothetical protein
MSRARLLAFSLCASAVVAACDVSAPGEPAAVTSTVPKASTDTSTNPPPSSFNLAGKVLGVDAVAGQGNDTLHFTPIAGANVMLVRNLLVNGKATQVAAGETTSGPDGGYRFANLAGGYYIVSVTPPAGSPYSASWSYVSGTAPNVEINVYLWRSK